ncbi:MAG: DUF3299 domain-containing protein [Planctomycetota bacterium]
MTLDVTNRAPLGREPEQRGSVQPVLLVTTFVALTLVLGAGYASIRASSADARRKIEAVPEVVQGASLRQDPAAADTTGQAGRDGAAADGGPQALPTDVTGATPLVSHGRVQDMASQLHLGKTAEGVVAIEYPDIALPDYKPMSGKDAKPRPNEEVFPPDVLALDGKEIALAGFMIPLTWDAGDRNALSFVLSPYPMNCHFGAYPRADEWIEVDAQGMGGTPFIAYRVVLVTGTIHLGEVYDEYGFLMNLYRIDASAVEEVK